MRRSFGGGNGMGWGGAPGSGGANGIFRTVSRVSSRAGMGNVQDPSSSAASNSSSAARKASKRGLSVGGSKSSAAAAAVYPTLSNSNSGIWYPAWPLRSDSSISDESDWVCVGDEDSCGSEIEVFDDYVFGSAPSQLEAQAALLSIQHALPTSPHPELDWNEPSLYPYGYEQTMCSDISRVYDAFHLLQTDPSVQRMVISLSSDTAVWKAVLNNEAVRELREAFHKDEANTSESSENGPKTPPPERNVLGWIFNNMRAKLIDFLAGITDLMKELFQSPGDDHQKNPEFPEAFGELVRASFMLTAIVLLVVVLNRASHA